ncbi:MAG: cell wall hydrolase [Oscillospiraceae bacterium]|nr:cell wall hydrolase [Oscillospiraceae bacterium]
MRKVKVAAAFLCLLGAGLTGGIAYQGNDVSVEYADRSAMLLELTEESAVTTASIETTAAAVTAATTAIPRSSKTVAAKTTTSVTTAAVTSATSATATETDLTSETYTQTTVLQSETVQPAATTAAPVRLQPVSTAPRQNVTEAPAAPATTVRTTVTEPQAVPVYTEPEPVEQPAEETAGKNYAISVTDREYIMLCNVVGHEYGADWVPTAEKALIAECIMNRVASPLFPNTVYDVLMQPGQFAGIEHLILMETMSSYVTQDVRDAVDLYLTHPEQFNHGYLFFSGDGYRSYFRTSY